MDPAGALRSIETALRLLVREVLGDTTWISAAGAPAEEPLRQKLVEEDKRRDGTSVSQDLLAYTETYQLTGLILKNWDKFKPVFQDMRRTEVFFGVIEDVRNSIAHSRDLVPFERDLISGVAGQLRSQIALFRSSQEASTKYYPLIEGVTDNFGRAGVSSHPFSDLHEYRPTRLEVGDTLTFDGAAFNARGKPVKWYLHNSDWPWTPSGPRTPIAVAEGDLVSFSYAVDESDVGENVSIEIYIAADTRYHRFRRKPRARLRVRR